MKSRSAKQRAKYPSTNSQAPPQSRNIDSTSGQSRAFPGLDDDNGAEDGEDGGGSLFYGPAETGLEYLKMVR